MEWTEVVAAFSSFLLTVVVEFIWRPIGRFFDKKNARLVEASAKVFVDSEDSDAQVFLAMRTSSSFRKKVVFQVADDAKFISSFHKNKKYVVLPNGEKEILVGKVNKDRLIKEYSQNTSELKDSCGTLKISPNLDGHRRKLNEIIFLSEILESGIEGGYYGVRELENQIALTIFSYSKSNDLKILETVFNGSVFMKKSKKFEIALKDKGSISVSDTRKDIIEEAKSIADQISRQSINSIITALEDAGIKYEYQGKSGISVEGHNFMSVMNGVIY